MLAFSTVFLFVRYSRTYIFSFQTIFFKKIMRLFLLYIKKIHTRLVHAFISLHGAQAGSLR